MFSLFSCFFHSFSWFSHWFHCFYIVFHHCLIVFIVFYIVFHHFLIVFIFLHRFSSFSHCFQWLQGHHHSFARGCIKSRTITHTYIYRVHIFIYNHIYILRRKKQSTFWDWPVRSRFTIPPLFPNSWNLLITGSVLGQVIFGRVLFEENPWFWGVISR